MPLIEKNQHFSDYDLKKLVEENPKSHILKGYVIVSTYWSQYAEGITGVNRGASAYLDVNGDPFYSKSEAIEATVKNNLKSYTRQPRDKKDYWKVGMEVTKVKSMRIIDLYKLIQEQPHSLYKHIRFVHSKK